MLCSSCCYQRIRCHQFTNTYSCNAAENIPLLLTIRSVHKLITHHTKSSMLIRFTDDAFDEHIQSTIGVDFKVKHLELNNKRIKLTVWDTAGQERFRTLTSSYYRGAQGVVMVYDVTRRDSFDNLEQWLKEVKLYSPNNGEGVVKLLVGNKIDLADGDSSGEYQRQVDRFEAEEWARNQGMLFLEASAKTRTGVQESFMEVVHKILEDPDLLLNTVPGKPKKAVNLGEGGGRGAAGSLDDGEGGYCC
jgi:Ras-related protein Rab-18